MRQIKRLTPQQFFRAVFVYGMVSEEHYIHAFVLARNGGVIKSKSKLPPAVHAQVQLRDYARGRSHASDYIVNPVYVIGEVH